MVIKISIWSEYPSIISVAVCTSSIITVIARLKVAGNALSRRRRGKIDLLSALLVQFLKTWAYIEAENMPNL